MPAKAGIHLLDSRLRGSNCDKSQEPKANLAKQLAK